jgi:hypothetical protein
MLLQAQKLADMQRKLDALQARRSKANAAQ